MKKILIPIIIIFSLITVKSQNYTTFNLYNMNHLLYNPAHYVHNDKLIIYTDARLQWAGVPGSPKTASLGFAYSDKPNMGYGVKIVNYNIGMFNYLNATAGYAYKVKLGEDNHFLKMGLAVGVSNDVLQNNNAENIDLSDVTLANDYYNKTTFSSDIGISYNYKNIQFDVMLPQIYDNDIFLKQTMAMLSYQYHINDDINLIPSVLVRAGKDLPFMADLNLMAILKKQLWAQLSYRYNSAYILSLGTNVNKFAIGYAFEFNNNKIGYSAYGSHEIQILYKLGNEPRIKKHIFRGTVVDKISNKPVQSIVKIYNNNQLTDSISSSNEGIFTVKLKEGQNYTVVITPQGYYGANENITVSNDELSNNKTFKLLQKTIEIKGTLKDSISNKALSNTEILFLSDGKIVKKLTTDQNGKYNVKLNRDKDYSILINKKNYTKYQAKITQSDTKDKNTIANNITLQPFIKIHGKITDKSTGKNIGASIDVIDAATNKVIKKLVSNSSTGEYEIKISGVKNIRLEVNSTGYMYNTADIKITKTNEDIEENITLQKLDKGVSIVLENVVFDKGKSTLKPESVPEIDRIIKVMKANKEIRIELSGHTDNVGSNVINTKISKERAQAVADYMISKGISADRLVVVGYGPKKPRASNDTPEGRERNRRVEAKVLK